MSRQIKVTWNVNDGYESRNRPQCVTVDENLLNMDWEEYDALTKEEQQEQIEEIVKTEFENNISWGISKIEDNV